eukprot:14144-Chlamydomonas_euryale.AAC.5
MFKYATRRGAYATRTWASDRTGHASGNLKEEASSILPASACLRPRMHNTGLATYGTPCMMPRMLDNGLPIHDTPHAYLACTITAGWKPNSTLPESTARPSSATMSTCNVSERELCTAFAPTRVNS